MLYRLCHRLNQTMIQVPKNIELIYYADHIEFVKDGNPSKPLSPKERKICDKVVEVISKLAGLRRVSYE